MAMFDCQRIDGRLVLRLRGNYHDVDGFAQHLMNLVWDLYGFIVVCQAVEYIFNWFLR